MRGSRHKSALLFRDTRHGHHQLMGVAPLYAQDVEDVNVDDANMDCPMFHVKLFHTRILMYREANYITPYTD